MRLALLADIHGNVAALEAVIADLGGRGVDRVLNLGDCVSGPLWPRETLARLRSLDWATVRGNHDRWVGAGDAAEMGPSDSFAGGEIDDAGRRWLLALPPTIEDPAGWLAIHARPGDDNAYLTEDIIDGRLVPTRPDEAAHRLGTGTPRLVLAAHSHLAIQMRLADGRTIVNPGSVGCPAYHDPTPPAHVSESLSPAARYAILTIDETAPEASAVDFIALPYDHAAAARRAASLGRSDWDGALLRGTMPTR